MSTSGRMTFRFEAGILAPAGALTAEIKRIAFLHGVECRIEKQGGWLARQFCCYFDGPHDQLLEVKRRIVAIAAANDFVWE